MKKIIYLIIAFCFLRGGNAFSQENDTVGLVIKTIYERDGFYGLGLDLGSLKDRKIEVYSDSSISKDFKDILGEDSDLVVVDKLNGSGETVEFSNGPKPEEITLTDTNEEVSFKTVNKEIQIQEMGGGREEIALFNKLMSSEHHTYNLNSIVSSDVTVKPLDDGQDSSMVKVLEWLVKKQ